jgi:uncharacterized protein (DUF983 family)
MKLYPVDTYQEVLNGLITNTVLVILATAAVGLRIWARYSRKVSLWIDDFTIIACLVLLYVLYGIQIACQYQPAAGFKPREM